VVGSLLSGVLPAGAVNVAQSVIVSADPVNWTPHVPSGRVDAILQIGNRVIVGGEFTAVRQTANGADIVRNNIFAFNATTGTIDTGFAPNLDRSVLALAPAPDGNVFVGGNFTTVNGARAPKLVKLNVTNGQRITSFTAVADARVRGLVVRGSTLYVAGTFTQLAGASREKLGAVNVTTGAIDPNLNLPITVPRTAGTTPSVYSMDLSPDGRKLVVIGNFTRIGGVERWQAGMIDLSTTPATVANWETDRYRPSCTSSVDTYMRDIDFSPDGSYFVIVTTGAFFGGATSGVLCDAASRWETGASGENLNPTWTDYTGGDTLHSVAITGTAVYIGGHQRWMNNPFAGDAPGPGAVPRSGIAAVDPVNGVPFSWNPGRDRGQGAFALYSTPAGLWVGSDTDLLGGETHRKLGMFPTAGGKTVPPNEIYELPADLFNAPISTGSVGFLGRRSFDGTTVGPHGTLQTPGFDWSTTRGAVVINGVLFHGTSGGQLVAHSFDGSSLGPGQAVNLNGLTNFPLANVTGMFFDAATERLYYTVSGDGNLYRRGFTPESRIVAAERFVAGGPVNWALARGVTMANGKIYYGSADGSLRAVNFVNGAPSGSPVVVSPVTAGYNWASRGLFVFGDPTVPGDTTDPSRPGKPSGQSNSPGTIDLTWAGSTDNVSSTLAYHVFRDGTEVATVDSSQSTVSFKDTGLAGGSTHTYFVVAEDQAGNESLPSPTSDPIQVQSGTPAIFSDDFSSGNFSAWTSVTGLTIDATRGDPSPPSARGNVSGQKGFASKTLGGTFNDICMSVRVNPSNLNGNSVDLFRIRTAANGPIVRVYTTSSGVLWIRSDFSGEQRSSGTALALNAWNRVELCGTVSPGTWSLYRNGTQIVNGWTANSGTAPAGIVQIGETQLKTWTMNFDDVVVDQTVG
jgi:beta-propeller uncharacterized protein DUF5122